MRIVDFAKKYWVIIAIILIMVMAFNVRMTDYRWPYLRNIDSYVYYRWMGEIVENDGVLPIHDPYAIAPVGVEREQDFIYPYFYEGAYAYMLTNVFIPDLTLIQFLIFFPPFLAALAVIPMYYIGRLLYDRRAGVLAAFFYAFDISNLSRSLGGDPDTDSIIMVFSMITMAAFLYTYKYAGKERIILKQLVLYSLMTAVVLWIWYSTWAGYWYIFWLITGLIVVKTLFNIIDVKDLKKGVFNSRYILLSFAIMMVVSFAFTVPARGTDLISSAVFGPIQFQNIKGEDAQFPNVYVSVAELQTSGGPREIIERTSVLSGPGILISPFFLMIYALLYLLYSYYKTKKHIDTALLLLVWFLGPFAATLVAVRFSILFSAPMAIGSAIILAKIIRMSTGEDKSLGD